MPNEARARLKINRLLEDAGWRLTDAPGSSANITIEARTDLAAAGDDLENTPHGFIDYLLLDDAKKPLVVLEAKRESIPPLTGKEQARAYANAVHARYIILSNGNTHYLWDTRFGNPEPILAFPTQAALIAGEKWKPDIADLVRETVGNNYIALSQKPDFEQSPDYQNETSRADYIAKNKLKILRDYQVAAIRAIQQSARAGNTRFLLEMATGTGKTLTCAAIIKLFLKTHNARRVLFLVDRIELENQAQKAFQQTIGTAYTVGIYKQRRDNWNTADVVVTTIQSLQSGDTYKQFAPTDFDLIISDEAHRSIGGNARAVFEYFRGFRIGLTATPKDFLKNAAGAAAGADSAIPNTQRAFERRELLDTYKTFGCESGTPTFRYGLVEGVNDPQGPFLVNPYLIDLRTEITTQLLDEKGFAVHTIDTAGAAVDEVFGERDFEKRFFNEPTNETFCRAFLKHAKRDPLSGEIGKTIIFAVSQTHAGKIAQILNKLAMQEWRGKYNSDFAIQITSNVADAQNHTIQFAENNLLGKTNFLPHYDSCRARVAVTVGMMTTGYDCADLLNVVFMRPVFSPSEFIQMKGRGTRLHTFKWIDYDNNEKVRTEKKTNFHLIDFFAVCEYFEQKYDYSEPLKLPRPGEMPLGTNDTGTGDGEPKSPFPTSGTCVLNEADPLKSTAETAIGNDGMRVDREMFRSFLDSAQAAEVRRLAAENRDLAKHFLKNEVFDKPEFFLNLEKLRKFFNLDRRLELDEALDIITGTLKKPVSRDEKIKQHFGEFIQTQNLGDTLADKLYATAYTVFDAYITDPQVRAAIDQREYGRLAGAGPINMNDLRALGDTFPAIIAYINDYVPVDKLNAKTL
ncbi:MAG: DEAD/DEAH box helicase family protein [Puniceicoccales bacterium]|jgi:type I restriction enzyme R subunit|nr:DEAD/DEAH box helicase family protein [Puniceicoccales bacterium]